VQRSKRAKLFQRGENLLVDKRWLTKLGPAVNNSVADRFRRDELADLARFLALYEVELQARRACVDG
jgi:hypothetical protein